MLDKLSTLVPGSAGANFLYDFALGLGSTTALSAGAAIACQRVVRRSAASRVTVELIPSPGFDPALEDVLRFATGLLRTRRTRFDLARSASGIRISLASSADRPGMLAYRLTLPRQALAGLLVALPGQVSVSEVDGQLTDQPTDHDEPRVRARKRLHRLALVGLLAAPDDDLRLPAPPKDEEEASVRARVQMELARPDRYPLRMVPVKPDPKERFAKAVAAARPGESVSLVIDLMPLAHAEASKWAATLRAPEQNGNGSRGIGGYDLHTLMTQPLDQAKPKANGNGKGPAKDRKLSTEEQAKAGSPLFHARILAVAEASTRDRAGALVKSITDPLSTWATDRQWLRAKGQRIFGLGFLGSDVPWRRGAFDRTMESGIFRGWGHAPVLSAAELQGLIVPPTSSNAAGNVVRSGSSAASTPLGMMDYDIRNPNVILIGIVKESGKDRYVGVDRESSLFAYTAGASGAGKSQWAMNLAVHLGTHGKGLLFVDPDQDAVQDLLHYFGAEPDKVWPIILNPTHGQRTLPGWNPIAVDNEERIEERVADVSSSFAAACGWDNLRTPRAMSLIEKAVGSLCHLALLLPPEDCPTIFQIETLLDDELWRKEIVPYLPRSLRNYWNGTFKKEAGDSTVTVTRLISRLYESKGIRSLLGSSISTYDISRVMQAGGVVLMCPAAASKETTALLSSLLTTNAMRAALNRKFMPVEERREFWILADECQMIPGEVIAEVNEHGRKYKVHLVGLNQDPGRLSDTAYTTFETNASILMASAMSTKGAARFKAKWGTSANPANLDLLTFLVSTRQERKLTDPFLVHTAFVRDVWASRYDPQGPAKVSASAQRRAGLLDSDAVLAALDTLDERILTGLKALDGPRPPKTPVRRPTVAPKTGGVLPMPRRSVAGPDQMELG